MAKDKKTRLHLSSYAIDPERIERRANEMAKEGWLLEKFGSLVSAYRRGEPNEYEYRVQVKEAGIDRLTYIAELTEFGIEEVGGVGDLLVLRKKADGTPFMLYSDLDARIMDARRLMRIKIILAVAFALLAADWFYNTWVWYDLAVSFDAMYADLRETYHQPSFLSLRLWGKHIIWYAVLGVLGTAAAVRTAMQAAHVGKTYGELKRKRLIEE